MVFKKNQISPNKGKLCKKLRENKLIECACGCGNKFLKYKKDKTGHILERKYLIGHFLKGKSKYNKTLKILCKCGCGQLRPKFDNRGGERNYIYGHSNKGKKQIGRKWTNDEKIRLSKTKIQLHKEGKIKLNSGIFKKGENNRRANLILPLKDTSIEVKIQNFLKQLGIEYFTHQYIKEIEHGYQCDILIPSMNMVIECDGNYWHKYPIGREIDSIRTSELLSKGFKVLRLWEIEIKKMNLNDFEVILEDNGWKR